jgi:hypothetical protein
VDGGRLRGTWISNSTVKVHGRETLAPYSGTVGIRKLDDVYHLTWWIGNEKYTGAGLLKGDLFIVGWSSGLLDGVTYYEIKGNELLGRWATSNDTTSGVENLIRTK